MMPLLPSEVESALMMGRVRRAVCAILGRRVVRVVFEHGHWWALVEGKDGTETYSVVDAEGGASVDGFDIERV